MGSVKTVAIKRLGNDLITKHRDKFSPDFTKNKEALATILTITSKRVRNILAGYITRKMTMSPSA